jgi:tripeptide aminopeptidase
MFTPDEEVGRGVERFDVEKFGAQYAYTMDGSTAGEVEDETFCADAAVITLRGRNVHPGYAKGKLVNSIKLAAELLARLPRDKMSPETTEGREGYLHPYVAQGSVEQTVLRVLVRDFSIEGLREKEEVLRRIAHDVAALDPRSSVQVQIEESYRNMKYVLDQHPQVTAYAEEAVRRAGLTPIRRPIRGGTDGARLCYMGLPTANIFAGGHNFHSQREWVSVQDMVKAVETIVNLAGIWAERAAQASG